MFQALTFAELFKRLAGLLLIAAIAAVGSLVVYKQYTEVRDQSAAINAAVATNTRKTTMTTRKSMNDTRCSAKTLDSGRPLVRATCRA